MMMIVLLLIVGEARHLLSRCAWFACSLFSLCRHDCVLSLTWRPMLFCRLLLCFPLLDWCFFDFAVAMVLLWFPLLDLFDRCVPFPCGNGQHDDVVVFPFTMRTADAMMWLCFLSLWEWPTLLPLLDWHADSDDDDDDSSDGVG